MTREAQPLDHVEMVLVVSAHEEEARRDRQAVKLLGARTTLYFASGSEAIDHLVSRHADLVLVDNQLADMDGLRFVKLLRLNMNLKSLPVVMVTSESKHSRVLEAIAAGVDGYVLRPYSRETFNRHVQRAVKLDRLAAVERSQLAEGKRLLETGRYDDAIEAFEELVSEENQAQKYYDLGCKYLLRQKFGQAIIAFKKAVMINDLFAEAYKGLAEAYKGKGDLGNYTSYLQKAAETFAHFNRMEETKELFIEILKYDAECPNPFNTLGVKLRKAGDLPGALHAYRQALELTPDDENIHFNMAKAHFFMGEVPAAKECILKSLWIKTDFEEARKLHVKLFGREFVPPRSAGPDRGGPDEASMESLKDV